MENVTSLLNPQTHCAIRSAAATIKSLSVNFFQCTPPSRPGSPLRFGRDANAWAAQVLVDLGFSYGQRTVPR